MKIIVRNIFDKAFTVLTGALIGLLVLILFVILGPMIWRGSSAVFFKATVEFQKMQLAEFGHGNESEIKAKTIETEAYRRHVYETIDNFKRGFDIEALTDKARKIHRDFGRELTQKGISGDQYTQLRSITRDFRSRLETTFASQDKEKINSNIEYILQYGNDERFKNTSAEDFFILASEFQKTVENVDLTKRYEYADSLGEVEEILFGSDEKPGLLGPHPDESIRVLAMCRYGATRWDVAQSLINRLKWSEKWVQVEPGKPLEKKRTPRAEQFAGTELEPLFQYIEDNTDKMLRPQWTFYWRYFTDDWINSHYFGGIGPEILGTLTLTILGMLFVIPLGIVSAAYLVECASDNFVLRIIRLCINTLAGVPSIVFGLFGLAFFVLFLFPLLNLPSRGCILAASMTLAILTLPVMIRSSEEAIRAVPKTYKEASLALGASRFRTFITVILPAALPGILTGIILSLSRIAGETAPILFAGAVALGPIPKSLFDPTRTLSYGSYDMAVADRLSMMVPHNQYGMVVTLILLILGLNALAIILRSRVFKKLKGH